MRDETSIVYWGPGLSGKSTNLTVLCEVLSGDVGEGGLRLVDTFSGQRSEDRISLQLKARHEEGLWVDLLAPPGQAHYREIRRGSLGGASGVVFVVDSSASAVGANLASLDELELLLGLEGREVSNVPLVFQYNKRELRDALSLSRLEELLNPSGRPWVEAISAKGVGVFPALKLILQEVEARQADVEVSYGVASVISVERGRVRQLGALTSGWSRARDLEAEGVKDQLGKMRAGLLAIKSPWFLVAGVLGGALLRELVGLLGALV